MAQISDLVWRADSAGNVTGITPCRPSATPAGEELDETEIRQLDELWRKCVRVVERFSAIYHVGTGDTMPRRFLVRAVPVLDSRDVVLYWSGIAAEADGIAEAATQFISEAASVLSSSLNRTTIVNRLVQISVERFCDFCAVHTFAEDGGAQLEGSASRGPEPDSDFSRLEEAVAEAARTRNPRLLGRTAWARSTIVVPFFSGARCIGTLSFVESRRSTSYTTPDMDVAIAVARQLAMALENIKTFEREQRLTEGFRFLARATDGLFTTLDQSKMLQTVLDTLADGFADYAVAASLADGRFRILGASGTSASFRDAVEQEIVASMLDRRSILSPQAPALGRRKQLLSGPLAEERHPNSWIAVPLFLGDAVFGTILCCSNSRRYDRGELEFLEEIGRRASLALEHAESFARERRLIQTLQRATLPTRLATVEGASLSAVYLPAAMEVKVGGDWYDAFDIDEHRVLLTVGDVTGHGLEASIVMGKLRHAINVVAMYERDPVRILDAAERVLLRRYPGSVATAFVGIFDTRDRTLTCANAGHPYPLLRFNDGSIAEIQAEGLPIGLRSAAAPAPFVTKRLDDASLLAFYTDGLTEATRDMLQGEAILREALRTDAIAYVDSPAEFIEKFCLREPSPDDVAILLLNFVASRRWTYDSTDRRAARAVRREFLAALAALPEPRSDLTSAELIFGELAANVAQHAGGRIEMALECPGGNAVLHVIDRDAGEAVSERRQADLMKEHGRGLWLVQRLGAKLALEALPGYGVHVRVVLPVRGAMNP